MKSDYDRAQLLISQAHTCLELGDRDGLASALGALRQITPLPDTLKARWHELMAWYEQTEERPLVATNHALMAEALFELEQMPDKQLKLASLQPPRMKLAASFCSFGLNKIRTLSISAYRLRTISQPSWTVRRQIKATSGSKQNGR